MGMFTRLVAACLFLAAVSGEAAARRVALVIGISHYDHAPALANPANDAADVAAKFRAMGFEVMEGYDLAKHPLELRISAFAEKLRSSEAGVLYFAGHGIAINGESFILPRDAKLADAVTARLETISAADLVDMLSNGPAAGIVIFDACRNNPFARGLSANGRGVQAYEGLSEVPAAAGTFVAYSTKPGFMALDGTARNSPFAEALLRHMDTPGIDIAEMMRRVRRDVLAATSEFQRPQWEDDLLDGFSLVPAAALPPALPLRRAPSDLLEAGPPPAAGLPEEIEDFIRNLYLKPDTGDVEGLAKQIFAADVTSFGSPFTREELVQARAHWLSGFRKVETRMLAGSLTATQRDPSNLAVSFDVDYRLWPADVAAASRQGRARVTLDLERTTDGWRVVSENGVVLEGDRLDRLLP